MPRVIDQVYQTTNYALFSKTDNRSVTHNKKLEIELLTHGQRQPIIVNGNFEVIDGQHRLYYLQKNGKPVKYIIDPDADFGTIISMNTSAKNWSLQDFIIAYANKGVSTFIELNNFIATHPLLSVNTIVVAGSSRRIGTFSNVLKKLKDGQYDFSNKQQLTDFYNFYENVLEKTLLPNKPILQSALWTLFTAEVFDEKRMLQQMSKINISSEFIEGYSEKMILVKFLELYNGRWSDDNPKTIQYYTNRKGALVIPGAMKK